jgi:hypothetical protein
MWGSGKLYVKPVSILQFPKLRISKGYKIMTREKMIEAMAKRMAWAGIAKYDASEDADDLWLNTLDYGQDHWLKIATAVLDLCGPEPLVWVSECGDGYIICRATCSSSKEKYTSGTDRNGDSYWVCDNLNWYQEIDSGGLEAAQAAAQAHATAAHWANTPLGKLVGVV